MKITQSRNKREGWMMLGAGHARRRTQWPVMAADFKWFRAWDRKGKPLHVLRAEYFV